MKYMGNPFTGSGFSGSPSTAPAAAAGQAGNMAAGVDYEKAYKELESRFGGQGQELGEYRKFFDSISPLLNTLDSSPELVQAIMDGKVNKDLAKAVLENRVDVRDAQIVQAAHDTVKQNLGKTGYAQASNEEITKLIEKEGDKLRKEFEEKAELASFEDYTRKFIENTPDFKEYTSEIDKWLDEHEVSDIEIADYAVKGQMSEKAAAAAAEQAASERAKDVIANAGGGGVSARYVTNNPRMVDQLISGTPNPNQFLR